MRRFALIAVFIASAIITDAHSQAQTVSFNYDLRPGDHLVYSQTFEREVTGPQIQTRTVTTHTSHVLVLGRRANVFDIGVQRNRTGSKLLLFKQEGKDRTAAEQQDFAQRVSKLPTAFADANAVTQDGTASTQWTALREVSSKLLPSVTEIMNISTVPRRQGETWSTPQLAGFKLTLTGSEQIGGEDCGRVETSVPGGDIKSRTWFCAGSSLIRKVELEGSYPGPGVTVHERTTIVLDKRTRDENVDQWLASPETQQAVLASMLAFEAVPATTAQVESVLRSGAPEAQATALALAYRRDLKVAPDLVASLRANGSDETKRIAAKLSDPPPPAQGCTTAPPKFSYLRPGVFVPTRSSAPAGTPPYLLRVPRDYGRQPVPMLIYLSGGSGFAMDAALASGPDALRSEYLIVYPEARDWWWRQAPTRMFADLLTEVIRAYNIDPNRVYIVGFSNGGTGALYYASLWPDRFAAAVSLMGSGVLAPEIPRVHLKNLRSVPMLFAHGDADSIVAVRATEQTVRELKGAEPRIPPEVHILKGRDHDLTLASDDGLSLPFLARYKREPFPRTLTIDFPEFSSSRHYWIEVLDRGKNASVDASIAPDNTISLRTKDIKRMRLLLRPELLNGNGPATIVANGKTVRSVTVPNDCESIARTGKEAGDSFQGYSVAVDIDLTH